MTFKIVVDLGKPYEKGFNDEREVLTYLEDLRKLNQDEFGYFDVSVFDSLNNDVSDYFFKKLKGGLKK